MKKYVPLVALLAFVAAVVAAGVQTWRLGKVEPCPPPSREVPGRYAEENARDRGKVEVVFMGDSITDGWDDSGEFFPGRPYANRGISGQATPEMLLRFRRDVLELKPEAVVIMAGTSDIALGLPTEETRRNIASMADLARANNIAVVFAPNLPVHDYVKNQTGSRPPERLKELNAWIQGYAQAAGHEFIDFRPAVSDERGMLRREFSEDGVHPNAAGYRALREALEAQTAGDGKE